MNENVTTLWYNPMTKHITNMRQEEGDLSESFRRLRKIFKNPAHKPAFEIVN
jgi:hypothetical protein